MNTHSDTSVDGTSAIVTHALDRDDAAVAAAMREMLRPVKGQSRGSAGRPQYDGLLESVLPRDDVTFENADVGGIAGVWVRPKTAASEGAILHLHGGWFTLGSASAYRHFVAQIAARAGANAFVPNYALAPEHPFPAAIADAQACFRALMEDGAIQRIALTGDSAGGNLALVLASEATRVASSQDAKLVALALMSPVTDLTLSGKTYETRAEADPLFTRDQVAQLVQTYLGDADPATPEASPLCAGLRGLPPMRVHCGDDEVLLDDSLRLIERAVAAGVDARLGVWMGMSHGFPINIGRMKASEKALDDIGIFLRSRLVGRRSDR